jgi:hypothetical protein
MVANVMTVHAQEQDTLSELDFESVDEDEDDEDEEEVPKLKKHKGGCAHGCKH